MKEQEYMLISADEMFGMLGDMLHEGLSVTFTVTGNSMWPLLRHKRDQVVLTKVDETQLKKGDIVLYSPYEGQFILHRITAIKSGKFRVTGDGNCFHDGYFPCKCVIGVVTSLKRGEKILDCKKTLLKLWSFLWIELYPVRRWLLWGLRKMEKLRK